MNVPTSILAGIVATTCSSCVTTPPQALDVSEALRDYSGQLGESHEQTVDLYHTEVSGLNTQLTAAAMASVDSHESDLRTLAARYEELSTSYDQVSAALESLLGADPSTPRADLLSRGESVQLAIAIVNEREREAEGRAEIDALLRRIRSLNGYPGGFKEIRHRIQGIHDELAARNDDLRTRLLDRIRSEYSDVELAYQDLLGTLEAHSTRRAERRRLLEASARSAGALEERVSDPDPLSRGDELIDVFEDELEED